MKIATARVVDGRLDLPEGFLKEGDVVTVLAPDEERSFDLSDDDAALLSERIAQADRGEVVDGWDLLNRLKA